MFVRILKQEFNFKESSVKLNLIFRFIVRSSLVLAILSPAAENCWAQTSGNIGYAQPGTGGKARAQQGELNKRTLTQQDLPPTNTSMFVDANVLMNVKADEYVAVFGLSQEGATVEESKDKMDAAIRAFKEALRPLAISDNEIFVDFITEPRIYGFDFTGDVARERQS